MKRILLSTVFTLFLIVLLFVGVIHSRKQVAFSATATHIVISEVQISGDGSAPSNDEFVELYNPTDSAVIMDGWRLRRKNSGGTEATLVNTLSGTIPAHGYFLVGHGTGYDGSAPLDAIYSAPSNALTNNYTVLLYSDAGLTLVDKVGFGNAVDFETSVFGSNPPANASIERKPGASDPLAGNSEDTDNNASDFDLRTSSDPQNSSSPAEVPSAPSPTPTPSETPTPTPSVTPTLTPTPSPIETPTPTPTPTISPTPVQTPTPIPSPPPRPNPTIPFRGLFLRLISLPIFRRFFF